MYTIYISRNTSFFRMPLKANVRNQEIRVTKIVSSAMDIHPFLLETVRIEPCLMYLNVLLNVDNVFTAKLRDW